MRGECSDELVVVFFNDTATTEIYTLSLHDALPISLGAHSDHDGVRSGIAVDHDSLKMVNDFRTRLQLALPENPTPEQDRKSTRLNSSHANISYAVFCLKKKNTVTHGRSSDTWY